ncbi:MAG TPA: ThiF family adenylyltransferase [Glaciibacter sp.]|nr:ThiF family adenylyltransferase [Glaciibacter sp.]
MHFEEPERYARQLALPGFGVAGQSRLGGARVLVVGAGGLGSAVLPLLASAGVGTIGVIDDDRVELSNLHRQPIHGTKDVGRSKVDSAAETLADLNPRTTVFPIDDRLTSSNALELFAQYDLVLDGSDNFPTRYLANDAAALVGIPLVWGAVSQYSGQTGVAWAASGPQYRDLFPTPPKPGSVLSCAEGGVMPTVCSVIGSIMATEALKLLAGIGEPLVGRVVTFDAMSGSFRELPYQRDPSAAPITGLIDYEAFCGVSPALATGGTANAVGRQEPDQVSLRDEISAKQLASELDAGNPVTLIDVREPWEAAIVSLPGSILIPLGDLEESVPELPADRLVVAYCHRGIRSEHALAILRAAGITNARHLAGGIDSWSVDVDSALARY